MDYTPAIRQRFIRQARRTDTWATRAPYIQLAVLRRLLRIAANTQFGRSHNFDRYTQYTANRLYTNYAGHVPTVSYEDIRPTIIRMIKGEKDILWPGRCHNFAQSSGTSGSPAKFIPITDTSLYTNHYPAASDALAAYLRLNPTSRIFSGKALILGGSFANSLPHNIHPHHNTRIGDLSATLIQRINPLVNHFRIPSKHTALLPDWNTKLPRIATAAAKANITNLSGVPSWFLILLRRILDDTGAQNLHDIWPNLEVFFHGGISFQPYRDQYLSFTDPSRMHFLETYNASEGFFAIQNDPNDPSLLLLLDRGVFYEFAPLLPDGSTGNPIPSWEVQQGKTYALVITSCNGLWRYNIGDTVTITSLSPLKIRIAGRTHSYINAFGEELMEHNAETAIARAAAKTHASVANYTAAPLYPSTTRPRGCHQWLIEWNTPPTDTTKFADLLDRELRNLNTDYDAKRTGNIFLDPPLITTARHGLFHQWLADTGNHRLGGQRKVPRLCPDRHIIDSLLKINNNE